MNLLKVVSVQKYVLPTCLKITIVLKSQLLHAAIQIVSNCCSLYIHPIIELHDLISFYKLTKDPMLQRRIVKVHTKRIKGSLIYSIKARNRCLCSLQCIKLYYKPNSQLLRCKCELELDTGFNVQPICIFIFFFYCSGSLCHCNSYNFKCQRMRNSCHLNEDLKKLVVLFIAFQPIFQSLVH